MLKYPTLDPFVLRLGLIAIVASAGCGRSVSQGASGAGGAAVTTSSGGAGGTTTTASSGGAGGTASTTTCFPHPTPYTPCYYKVDVIGPDGTTYRGRIFPDTTIASYPEAASTVKLDFSGSQVDLSGGACEVIEPQTNYQVQVFVTLAGSSVDDAGTLHVHGGPRDGYYASGPNLYANDATTPGWTVDLTVTKEGLVAATLTRTMPDAGTALITMNGTVDPLCYNGAIPVTGGASFTFPCPPRSGCL